MLDVKSILITGGTGSFGKKFVERLLNEHPEVKRIVIYSRDELKQYEMKEQLKDKDSHDRLRFFIGNVRDESRLQRACEGVDCIVHAAALKQVPAAEYNPTECIRTNINGAENVISAALSNNVRKVIALSTDKAAAPINLYGATKLCSDKLFVAANTVKGNRELTFSVVRYGNVMGSRGSVIPHFIKQRETGTITVTHPEMTRFNITLDQGIDMVLYALENSWGGEIFIPKIPSYNILEIAKAIAPNCKIKEIGIRPGEKLHEEMITETDSLKTIDCGKYYVILPSVPVWSEEEFVEFFKAKRVKAGFKYNSGINTEWINCDEIRKLIKEKLYPDFIY